MEKSNRSCILGTTLRDEALVKHTEALESFHVIKKTISPHKLLQIHCHGNTLANLAVTANSYGVKKKEKELGQEAAGGSKDIIGYYAEDIKDSSRLPGFSPTAASAQSVQVEGSRWERSNECKDAGHDPHYRHFALGRAKNRHFCSQRVKQHQTNGDIPLSLSQIFVSYLEDASRHTHTLR